MAPRPLTLDANRPTAPDETAEPVVMPEWKGPSEPPRGPARWIYGSLLAVLVVGFVAQMLFHYRHAIAADYPSTRGYLVSACSAIGCRIEPLRNRDEIAIESHDLQADPAHQGLLILQATLRNQASHALAFPHIELELDDNAGRPVVRRVFAPNDYAGGAADFAVGIPASSEWNVKLFLDASSVSAAHVSTVPLLSLSGRRSVEAGRRPQHLKQIVIVVGPHPPRLLLRRTRRIAAAARALRGSAATAAPTRSAT